MKQSTFPFHYAFEGLRYYKSVEYTLFQPMKMFTYLCR